MRLARIEPRVCVRHDGIVLGQTVCPLPAPLGGIGFFKGPNASSIAEAISKSDRYVNRILRNVIAMVRLAEARGVQLKNSRPLSLP